ncbi:type II toxin-antitoxin system PemK/MazF family toxin [Streptomyces sp. ISL-87]|nr:type II toxin-antitoxin system PemK/MazF family toxin [Streptomyces sp. ISL-21]MBT2445611.1 type II toxin-antitoxin system PemK/MazF family toxin [Streptomyces sp. ISL-43]MBT2458207.1 type II toxin-antitoxin system PemK/MazF family toxin [Streptomyces sp. ISL-86]MBT2612856.1 type II toxin-antitoxin system PemK/MazF family toxin [Streptomyces sp. ISL-87]
MVNPGTALRGEVWVCALPQPVGPHPVVVLTVNRIAEPLASVTVALITGTSGPQVTHVPIGPDAGLTKYDESYVNCADLHTVAKSRLRRKLGLLAPGELHRVEGSVRLILGLQR